MHCLFNVIVGQLIRYPRLPFQKFDQHFSFDLIVTGCQACSQKVVILFCEVNVVSNTAEQKD